MRAQERNKGNENGEDDGQTRTGRKLARATAARMARM